MVKAFAVSTTSKGPRILEMEIERFAECVVFDKGDTDNIALADDGFTVHCKTMEEAEAECLRISEKRLAMMEKQLDDYRKTVEDMKITVETQISG